MAYVYALRSILRVRGQRHKPFYLLPPLLRCRGGKWPWPSDGTLGATTRANAALYCACCPQVTWVVHAEYDEAVVHQLYRPLLQSGQALGARRWLASLQRQCQYLAILCSNSLPARDHAGE